MSARVGPDRPASPLSRAADIVVLAGFLVAVSLPGVANLLHLDAAAMPDPKNELAPWPGAPTAATLLSWPGSFKSWFEDHFGFRRQLIRAHALTMFEGLGVSPSPTVLIGKDGWFYYTDDGALDDYVSAVPLTDPELQVWQRALEGARDWLKERRIPYLFVLAPDKHVLYPEFMPDTVRPLHETSRLDQFVSWMNVRSTVPVIDLRQDLRLRKKFERVYFKTDTHWNGPGALTAYLAIGGWLMANLPSVGVIGREAFTVVERDGPGQDLGRMLGIEDAMREELLVVVPETPRTARVVEPAGVEDYLSYPRIVMEKNDPRLPRAVVFRDSFAAGLIPFLAEHFSRVVFVWQRDFDPDIVRAEKPDVVIHQMVGRRLTTYAPYDAVAEERLHGAGSDTPK